MPIKTCILITNDVDEVILLADRILNLTPEGRLGQEFAIKLPRPRDRIAMNHDAAFKALRGAVTTYLMEIGIDAKVAETRVLPKVTPIHGVPKAVVKAQDGLIADRFVDFSQLHKVYATPKGPLTVVENFDLKRWTRSIPRRPKPSGRRWSNMIWNGSGWPMRWINSPPACRTA